MLVNMTSSGAMTYKRQTIKEQDEDTDQTIQCTILLSKPLPTYVHSQTYNALAYIIIHRLFDVLWVALYIVENNTNTNILFDSELKTL